MTIAETVGLVSWHLPTLWNTAKLSCDNVCTPIYAEHVARLIAALRGRSRKCLILDLDNTVWGGVIGDDGLEGIKIAQGDEHREVVIPFRARAFLPIACRQIAGANLPTTGAPFRPRSLAKTVIRKATLSPYSCRRC